MKKAMIFTIDAAFAAILAMAFTSAILFYVSQDKVVTYDQGMHRLALDTISVMEKKGLLNHAALTNSSVYLASYLNTLPDNICARVTIADKYGSKHVTAVKSYCTLSQEYAVARRVFVADAAIFVGKLEVWRP